MPLAPPTNRMHRSFGRRAPPPKPPRFVALRLACARAGDAAGHAARGLGKIAAAGAARARGAAEAARDLARRTMPALERLAPQARALAAAAAGKLRLLVAQLAAAGRHLAAVAYLATRHLLARARTVRAWLATAIRRGTAILLAIDLAGHVRRGAAMAGVLAVLALLGGLFLMAGQGSRTAPRAIADAIAPAPLPEPEPAAVPVPVPPRPVAVAAPAAAPVAPPEPEPATAPEPVSLDYTPPVPRPRPEPPAPPEEATPREPTDDAPAWRRFAVRAEPGDRPRIAIVIDDLGLDRAATRRLAAIEGPLTLAFLPYADDLPGQTARVRDAGHELLVHMPMAPRGGVADPGPMALLADVGEAELRRRIAWNLSRFEGYVGVNNHMGSGLTADPAAMGVVMRELAARGRLFLDSRTTSATVAQRAAERAGIANAGRDVFLDNEQDARAVEIQFDKLEAIARRRGAAIGIGHPHDATLDALERRIAQARARGFALVPVSALVRQPATTRIAAAGAGGTAGSR